MIMRAKLVKLIMCCLSLATGSAAANDDPNIVGARKLAVLDRLATLCDIEASQSMRTWISKQLKTVTEADRHQYALIGDNVLAQYAASDGRVGACYKVRMELYRDGWLPAD